MKNFRLLIIAICTLIAIVVTPVSAGAMPFIQAQYAGEIYVNDTVAPQDPATICALYGETPSAGFETTRYVKMNNNMDTDNLGGTVDASGSPQNAAWTYTFSNPDKDFFWTHGWVPGYISEGATCTGVCIAADGGQCAGRWWNVTSGTHPVQFYHNITINVKTSGGLNLPRAHVEIKTASDFSVLGETGLDGNFTTNNVLIYNNFQPYVTVSKAGFNTSNTTPAWDVSSAGPLYAAIVMGDLVPPTGGQAYVYVDIIDANTQAGITGATVGIENTTAAVNQWYYYTEPNSTATFTTTGLYPQVHNLSVGQAVVFAGYKTGAYTANNSGTYIIPSAISHTSLYLVPATGNTSAGYFWPVTVVDASTGSPIGNSNLSQALECAADFHDCVWYNHTSSDGKFNVTGYGSSGSIPLSLGDHMILQGNAFGYAPNGFVMTMTASTNGVTQPIPLSLTINNAKPGEFTAVVSTYEKTTTNPIGGVTLALSSGSVFNNTKVSSAYGTAIFTNLSSNLTYTLSATRTGYSPVSLSVTGTSATTQYVNVQMSASGVNPTPTASPVTTVTTSSVPAENADNAIALLSSYLYTFMSMAIFIVFFTLFWMVIYAMTGGKIITMILQRGRGRGRG